MENDDGWELGETKTTNMPEEVICALKLEDLNKGATIAFVYAPPHRTGLYGRDGLPHRTVHQPR